MKVHVGKWGNSLAVRIPAPVAEGLRLNEGSELELAEKDGAIVLTVAEKRKRYPLAELVDKITDENRHEETNWGAAAGREEW